MSVEMTSNVEIFLDKYRELENAVQAEFRIDSRNTSPIVFLSRRGEFQKIRNELDCCREVRNILSHNPKINGEYAVIPGDRLIKLLDDTIRKVQNPPRIRSIAVKRANILCKSMDDAVYPTMEEMIARSFTYIPIMEVGVAAGVFSENTLLTYIVEEHLTAIDTGIRFRDIVKYISIENKKPEIFRFVPENTRVADVQDLFEEATKKAEKIGLVFLTQNGKRNEKILGMVTAWDVAGKA